MKKTVLCLLSFALFVVLSAFMPSPPPAAAKLKIPKKINNIIQSKCYGCHSPQGKGEKARKKLNWDELPALSAADQLEKMKMIQGVLEDGSMPPSFLLEKDPSKKLTPAESAKMKKWANKTARKLSK